MEREENKETQKNILPKINLVLIISLGVLGFLWGNHFYNEFHRVKRAHYLIKTKIKKLETKADELQKSINGLRYQVFLKDLSGLVDFTVPDIQKICDGFFLANAEQQKHLTGLKFKGRIINTQSVGHRNITFKLTVNKISKNFTIRRISPGHSTRFTVYVPDITPKDARFARIEYVESVVEFLK